MDRRRLQRLVEYDLEHHGGVRSGRAYATICGEKAEGTDSAAAQRYKRAVRRLLADRGIIRENNADLISPDLAHAEEMRCVGEAVPPQDLPSLGEILDHAERGKDLSRRIAPLHQVVDIHLPTHKPVAVCFTSDWHLGSLGTDYKRWREDFDYLCDTHGLYTITVGDLLENKIRFRNIRAIFSQVLSPEQQDVALQAAAEKLIRGRKLLAVGWGNHDNGGNEHAAGYDWSRRLFDVERVPYFVGVGLIRLHVGFDREDCQTYTILMNHTPRGKSQYNKNHGNIKSYLNTYPADVCVSAHLHQPAISVDNAYPLAHAVGDSFGGRRICIATGTYNTEADYAIRWYHGSGSVGAPTVLFWPDERRTAACWSAEDAMALRRGYGK